MSRESRQRYNFLVALMDQVRRAKEESADEYEQFRAIVQAELVEGPGHSGSDDTDRLDAHAQWLAALEARMEDLEQAIELVAGEEPDDDDDGDYDEDVGGDEPLLDGRDRRAGSESPALVRAGQRQVAGRPVMDEDRSRVFRKVGFRRGPKPTTDG